MPSSEPERADTSLELTFPERDADPAPTGTSLELPPSDPPPPPAALAPAPSSAVAPTAPASAPAVTSEEPVAAPAPASATRPLGNLVAAHFRRVEVAMLGRVLVTTLSGALPPSMVTVERRRKLFGGGGEPIGVTVTAGERRLAFRAPEVGVVEATVAHVVRGVTLSTEVVPLARWLDELGEVLEQVGRDDEAARVALERALT